MAWRLVAEEIHGRGMRVPMAMGVRLAALLWMAGSLWIAGSLVGPAVADEVAGAAASQGADLRVATFHGEGSDEAYFALSVQPGAGKSLIESTTRAAADVAIVVDTSASQTGAYRDDSLRAVEGVLARLRDGDRARVYAADVRAADLSGAFHGGKDASAGSAMSKLRQRLPLGSTNLLVALDAARGGLVGEPSGRTRSIVYIGDGAALDAAHDGDRFAGLVDALRADRIAVHSIGIGPSINIELMGVLANQTGGVLGTVGGDESTSAPAIAREVGRASTVSPIWVREAVLPAGVALVHGRRLPPLRVDRDSILIGTLSTDLGQFRLTVRGETADDAVAISAEGVVEENHPDFAFLPGLFRHAAPNEGLYLASAGSPMLRNTARAMVAKAEELVRAGKLALGQGNHRGAKVIADLAIEADPLNADAIAIRQAALGQRLVAQNEDDPFGGGADDDPFGGFGDEPEAISPPADLPPAPQPPRAAPRRPAPAADTQPDRFRGPVGDDELLEAGGDLLDRVQSLRAANEGRLRAEVRAQLNEASRQMRQDPTGVSGQLKSLLARVEAEPDIDPQLRQELLGQVRSAIQIAGAREAEFAEAQATLQERAAGAAASRRILEETFRRDSQLQALSQQLNALIAEGRYQEADGQVSLEFARIAGDTITNDSVAGRHFTDFPLSLQTYARDRRYREMRERNFVDVFSEILKANIPFVGDPPIVYPDAEVWQNLSRRRIERYQASVEIVGDSAAARRIQRELSTEVSFDFPELPLEDAARQISDELEIPIVIDRRAIEELGLTTDTPVNLSLENVTLRSFLRLMLRELDLTYMIKDEVLQITSRDAAEENLITQVYPVGDLVVPIMPMMGGGMMGGMMGGGMMGGMGGGMMGGMGGGMMGGMGGGMMGGMGGMGGMGMMGGGMMAVPEDAGLRDKAATSASPRSAISDPDADASEDGIGHARVATGAAPIRLQVAADSDIDQAWDNYFAGREVTTPEQLSELDGRVRATIREWNIRANTARKAGDDAAAVRCFDSIRAIIGSAMRSGHVQPWMYQAYAIALQATGAPSEDVERALLSAVDFAQSPEDVLHVAARLEESGAAAAALELCRQVSAMDPYRREPYVMGLRIAKELADTEGLAWACRGVLGAAWPESFQPVVEEARLTARATYQDLVDRGELERAAAFGKSLEQAVSHDAVVRVSWTGEADVDILVEEPSGTVCSLENRTTAGGGTLMGDGFPGRGQDETGTISEFYVCPQGFSGEYRVLIRRVWGNVSAGKVTIEILTDVGRPSQRYIREQIPLTERDALVVFEVKEGRRQQEVAEAQLAHLRDVQRDVQGNVLGQILGDGNQEVLSDFLRDMARVSRMGVVDPRLANNPFFRRGAVGFRPELTVLPTGANLMGQAITSADRRYVRVTPMPMFSQVGDVSTFNFVTGDEGGGGAGGGIGGGIGGGMGMGGGIGGGMGMGGGMMGGGMMGGGMM